MTNIERMAKEVGHTMDDRYGDGSDHLACSICGLCKTCKDCKCAPELAQSHEAHEAK